MNNLYANTSESLKAFTNVLEITSLLIATSLTPICKVFMFPLCAYASHYPKLLVISFMMYTVAILFFGGGGGEGEFVCV